MMNSPLRGLKRPRRISSLHRLLLFETLEERWALASLMSVSPSANSHGEPLDSPILAIYDRDIDSESISAQAFAVHGMQTGQLRDPPNAIRVSGTSISFTSAEPFRPGELVQVTPTTGIKDLVGETSADPFVWQFRSAVGVGNGRGTGFFAEGSQILGARGLPLFAGAWAFLARSRPDHRRTTWPPFNDG